MKGKNTGHREPQREMSFTEKSLSTICGTLCGSLKNSVALCGLN